MVWHELEVPFSSSSTHYFHPFSTWNMPYSILSLYCLHYLLNLWFAHQVMLPQSHHLELISCLLPNQAMYAAQMQDYTANVLFSLFGHTSYFHSPRSLAKIRNIGLVIQNPDLSTSRALFPISNTPHQMQLTCITCSPHGQTIYFRAH